LHCILPFDARTYLKSVNELADFTDFLSFWTCVNMPKAEKH